MEFNLQEAKIYRAVVFQKFFNPRILKFTWIFFLILWAVSSIAYLLSNDISIYFPPPQLPDLESFKISLPTIPATQINLSFTDWLVLAKSIWLGFALIFFTAGFSVLFAERFFSSYLKCPKIKNKENLAEFLDFDSAVIAEKAMLWAYREKRINVSTDNLLQTLLDYAPAESFFSRVGIEQEKIKKEVETVFRSARENPDSNGNESSSGELLNFFAAANDIRVKHNHERVTMADIFTALFDFNDIFQRLIIGADLNKSDLDSLAMWQERNMAGQERRGEFWTPENLSRHQPIGTSWVYGYPRTLQRFTIDITKPFSRKSSEINIMGRDEITNKVEQTLSQIQGSNILLVGDAGVGKRAVISNLAQRIALGSALPQLNYKRILELNVPSVTASSKEAAEVQNILGDLLSEAARVGNIILFIDGFHNFVGALSGLGRSDISQILIPYLESTNIQLVVTTDPVSFHKYLETSPEVLQVFEKIEVPELEKEDTMKIIEDVAIAAEKKFGVWFLYGAIKNIVGDAGMYIPLVPFPAKAVDLLNDVVTYARTKNKKIIVAQDVHEVITQKTHIPLGIVGQKERETLINLEEEMHKEIVNQEEAVRAVAQAVQRLRIGLSKRGKPAGVFLFVGPTGVGKTMTAKMLAKTYFGSPDNMIRFDMSEYQGLESLDRLLGSAKLNDPGQLGSAVRDNPFSVLLLDEFEKASKNILNIFLRVFDEGVLTDALGRKVNFEQNIIIATSNAGADFIREMVRQGIDPASQVERIIDLFIKEGYFQPELLNRFDEIVIFHHLSKEHIYKIAELLISKLAKNLYEQGYFFKPTPEIAEYIARVGFDPQFGARPMNRVVQNQLESVIAQKILKGEIKKGVDFSLPVGEIGEL